MKKVLLLLLVISIIFVSGCFNRASNNTSGDNQIISGDLDASKKKTIKEDETKEWVYDATYNKDVLASSYTTYAGNEYYASSIVVPYVNISSSNVASFNSDIKQAFNHIVNSYNEGVNDKTTYIDQCDYNFYVSGDTLSVVLTYGIGATDVVAPIHVTGVFSTVNGKKISFEDAYALAGFADETIDEAVEKAVEKEINSRMDKNLFSEEEIEKYIQKSLDSYYLAKSTNIIKYYLADNLKLVVEVTLNIPAGREYFDTLIPIE